MIWATPIPAGTSRDGGHAASIHISSGKSLFFEATRLDLWSHVFKLGHPPRLGAYTLSILSSQVANCENVFPDCVLLDSAHPTITETARLNHASFVQQTPLLTRLAILRATMQRSVAKSVSSLNLCRCSRLWSDSTLGADDKYVFFPTLVEVDTRKSTEP